MNALLKNETAPMLVEFTLNGRSVTARPDESLLEAAKRMGVEIPHLCYMEGMRPAGNCRSCMVEIKGERVLAPSCCRYPKQGMHVTSDSARAVHSQKMILELLKSDMPDRAYKLGAALRAPPVARTRSVPPRHGRQPGRLHPVHTLRACLQGGASQRCHRLRLSWPSLADRVRSGRSDGQVHLCRLRRMRAGLPDRRSHAGARRWHGGGGQDRRFTVPVLRRRLPVDLPRQGQPDPARGGARWAGEPRPPVREGSLRLRLRAPQAAPDQAPDPQTGHGEVGRFRGRPR